MDEKSWRTWKSNQKILMDEEVVQNIVMNEELVPNGVMDEKIVKNFVMGAKIDPKVVMDLSKFKIGGWSILQPSNRRSLEEFIDENEPWLWIRSPSKFLRTQCMEQRLGRTDLNVKELTSLREGLHEMMPCDRRQHFAAINDLREHPERQASWKESTRMKFMDMPSERSKMRSESSEYMWKTTGASINCWRIKTALESYFQERAQETWERNLRKTTLLHVCNPILMETILKVLREQFKDDDQRKATGEIAGIVPETSLEWEPILIERGGFWGGQRWIFAWRSGVDCEPGLVHRPVA